MKTFKLRIVTPKGPAFEGEVRGATFPAEKGPLGILPGHIPFLSIMAEKGLLKLQLADGGVRYFASYGGSLSVRRDETLLLVEKIVEAKSLEEAKAILAA